MSPATLRNNSFHLEAGLARGQCALAGHRKGIGPVQRTPALGKAIYEHSRPDQVSLSEVAGLYSIGEEVRPTRQVPQRFSEHEYLRRLEIGLQVISCERGCRSPKQPQCACAPQLFVRAAVSTRVTNSFSGSVVPKMSHAVDVT